MRAYSIFFVLVLWLGSVHAADPVDVYKFGAIYYPTFAEAESAMRLSVPQGGDLEFKSIIQMTGGVERHIYTFQKKQFTRLGPAFYRVGTLSIQSTGPWRLEPIDTLSWTGPCAAQVKASFVFVYGGPGGDVKTYNDTDTAIPPPIPSHKEYVRSVHRYRTASHSVPEDGCKPIGESSWRGSILKVEPIKCPEGYKPAGVNVAGVPFIDVCRAIDTRDFSIYKEKASCPVAPLTLLDDLTPNDADSLNKTRALERGENAYTLLSDNMKTAEQCLAAKFAAKGTCYRLESTYRSPAYQKHLREIWDKWRATQKLKSKEKAACKTTIDDLNLEIGGTKGKPEKFPCNLSGGRNHCIRARPASTDAKHTQGDAVDVTSACVDELKAALVTDAGTVTISTYMGQEPKCDVKWGGDFSDYDPVHFKYEAPPAPTPEVQ